MDGGVTTKDHHVDSKTLHLLLLVCGFFSPSFIPKLYVHGLLHSMRILISFDFSFSSEPSPLSIYLSLCGTFFFSPLSIHCFDIPYPIIEQICCLDIPCAFICLSGENSIQILFICT